jgi:hypothetical protein
MRFGFTLMSAFLALSLATLASAGPVVFNPQIGVSGSQLSSDPPEAEQSARVGWQIGGFLRAGQRFYIQPGLFYQQTTINLQTDDSNPEDIEDDLGISGIHIPALVGFNITSSPAFTLRANGGPSATIITSVKDNEFDLEKDQFEDLTWGAIVGVGADISMFTLDASYEFGMTDSVKDSDDSKQNVGRFSAGLKF